MSTTPPEVASPKVEKKPVKFSNLLGMFPWSGYALVSDCLCSWRRIEHVRVSDLAV